VTCFNASTREHFPLNLSEHRAPLSTPSFARANGGHAFFDLGRPSCLYGILSVIKAFQQVGRQPGALVKGKSEGLVE